jgi:hypothetical protein
MSSNEQKIRQLKDRLKKRDTSVLLQTLKEVKMEGNHSLIPYLVMILNDVDSQDIENRILDILNNLNSQSAASYLIEAIENTNDEKNLHILISACWKNGLDYSLFLDVFVNLFIEHDFDIALEAFTVIENATKNAAGTEIDRMLDYMKSSLADLSNEKQALMKELIYMLERRKETYN